jgi:hypothetical protein
MVYPGHGKKLLTPNEWRVNEQTCFFYSMERKKEIFFWWKKCFGAVVSLKKLSLQTIDFISLSTFFQTSLKHFWSRGILSM